MLPPLLVEAEDIIRIYSEICFVLHSWWLKDTSFKKKRQLNMKYLSSSRCQQKYGFSILLNKLSDSYRNMGTPGLNKLSVFKV